MGPGFERKGMGNGKLVRTVYGKESRVEIEKKMCISKMGNFLPQNIQSATLIKHKLWHYSILIQKGNSCALLQCCDFMEFNWWFLLRTFTPYEISPEIM